MSVKLRKCKIIAVISDDDSSWQESFIADLENCSSLVVYDYLQSVVDCFNDSLRPNESKRKLVKIISSEYI